MPATLSDMTPRSRRLPLVLFGLFCLGLGHASGVKDASASPYEPQTKVVEVACDRVHFDKGVGVLFAEHELPGAPVNQLGRVTIVGHLSAQAKATALPGYEHEVVHHGIFGKEGSLAVSCGLASSPRYDKVALAIPRAALIDLDRANPW